ncbi:MAG TPA: very short patch repair endonuclease [Verrucomicrobiae bacterium]|nr:very short patch repair endonuclease [Verrucomicrobiae bacterium]
MAAIRSTGNQATELRLARIFRRHGITGWRRQQRLIGKPDFIFRQQKLAVFVDGCFWHGCHRHCRMPQSRCDYWTPKIARNMQRDLEITATLRRQGWRVYRVWEHYLRHPDRVAAKFHRILGKNKQNGLNVARHVSVSTHNRKFRGDSSRAL